jgi:hypothetical protein
MADHPAIAAARNARGPMLQFALTLSGHMGEQPLGVTIPTKFDDVAKILDTVAGMGWDLVAMSTFRHHPQSNAVGAIYVWNRS